MREKIIQILHDGPLLGLSSTGTVYKFDGDQWELMIPALDDEDDDKFDALAAALKGSK